IAELLVMQKHRARRERVLGGVIGWQVAHREPDTADCFARGGIIERGDCGDGFATIPHLFARERMLAARDWEHTESLIAVGAGDDRYRAGHFQRFRYIHRNDLAV